MTRADLLALADRVEREEPSKELHHAVLHACGWSWRRTGRWINDATGEQSDGVYGIDPLHSLDAADSLMPEGWTLYSIAPAYGGITVMFQSDATDTLLLTRGFASDERRARTAAALRARAQEMGDE